MVCEKPREIGGITKAEILGNVRDGGRRVGQDAFRLEHNPIMDDRLGREPKLTAADATEMCGRDAERVRVG
jgi:hypothetical protein